jgi:hypothetical protein
LFAHDCHVTLLVAESPFAEVLAKTICAQIIPDRPYSMPDAVRTKLPSIRQGKVLDPRPWRSPATLASAEE